MKISAVVLALAVGADAYSVSRSSLRSMGSKSVSASSSARKNVGASIKMEGTCG